MHRLLFDHTHHLDDATLTFCAATLRLDIPLFLSDLEQHVYARRVREDFESGLESGVCSTPTLYINGVRHDDYGDVDTLLTAMDNNLKDTEGKFDASDAKQWSSVPSLSCIHPSVLAGSAAAAVFSLLR